MKDFYDLFIHELQDMYSAELQIVKALPEMARAAHHPDLKEAFRNHRDETQKQIERLEKAAEELGVTFKEVESPIMMEMLKEGKKVINSKYASDVKDAALITAAQRVEHYEMACYGILKSFAKQIDRKDIVKLLDESSKEEGNADKKLTEIAEGTLFNKGVNEKALKRKTA